MARKISQRNPTLAFKILKQPHISEKAAGLKSVGKYVFKVFNKATKVDIKNAIRQLYNVEVEGINIIRIPSKRRRLGKYQGRKSGFKKAIITLKKGQKIEKL